MTLHRLWRAQVLQRPRREVFAFFEDATNLALITPPFLRFEMLTKPPIAMGKGTIIDYRIRLFGVPLRWRSEIIHYVRGEHFIDLQIRGPYRLWRHTHTFRDVPGGTLMLDEVAYSIGFGPLGALAHRMFVRRTLAGIFDYRAEVVARLFDGSRATPDPALSLSLARERGGRFA